MFNQNQSFVSIESCNSQKLGLGAPKAGVMVAPDAGVLVAPNAGPVEPNAGWDEAPKGVEPELKMLLPNSCCNCWMLLPNDGCDGWVALPNGLVWVGVEPKPPRAGFWPSTGIII